MLTIKKSRLPNAGKGLFTTSRIRKGDVIVEYKGEKMSWNDCVKRYGKKNVNKAPYLFHVSDKNCVDAQRTTKELARYANDANGFSQVEGVKNNSEYDVIKGKPYIIATKEIAPGCEIFVDYAGDYWEVLEV